MNHGNGPQGYGSTRQMAFPVPQRPQFPPPGGQVGPGGPSGPGGPYGPVGQARPRRRRRWRRIVVIVLAALLALVGGLAVYLELALNRVDALGDYQGRPAQGAGTNWLIVGSDSRAGLSPEEEAKLATGDAAGQRTDTIMLLHLPANGTKPTLVSLLRDSYVPIEGHGRNKLNAAYSFGGPKLLARTVEQATGLRLDHYAEIGFGGFANLVDAVGGVQMCIDKPMNDPKAGINLQAGCQTLNGTQALGYVRTRATPSADLDRVVHQRQFVGALMSKATSFGTVVNPFRSIPLLADAPDAITVDSGTHLWNMPGIASAMSGASDGSLLTTTVPFQGGSHVVAGAGDVVLWDNAKAGKLFEDLRTDAQVADELITFGH